MKYSTCIGIDTHSRKNAVCALDTTTGETVATTLSDDPDEIVRWVGGGGFAAPVMCVYEAGPTGFGLARALHAAGIGCVVAATAKLAYPKDRNKTDERDAAWLARQLAAGAVREVRVPSEQEESLCRLSKLRGEAAADLRRAKQRVRSFLLLTRTRYTATRKCWTKSFMAWAETLAFPNPEDTFTFREKFAEVRRLSERLERIEAEIGRVIEGDPALRERMARLTSLHGIGRITAFALICEACDFGRFRKGSAFASFLGLAPSEHPGGERRSHGRITKMGNPNLRRLMVEAASCYSRRANPARARPADVPAAVAERAQACQDRLLARRERLRRRGVAANKAKCAVARELAVWVWHVMVMEA